MYREINERLSECLHSVRRLKKVENIINGLKMELDSLLEKEFAAKAVFEKENRDYEKLKERSISSIFYSITGKLEEKSEKEHREAISAELAYNRIAGDIEDVKKQIFELETEIKALGDPGAEYDMLYKDKLKFIRENDAETTEAIDKLLDRRNICEGNLREAEEAINAGSRARELLSDAVYCLEEAQGWGNMDILGGGFITGMAKHSRIDRAVESARQANVLLNRFKAELCDIQMGADFDFDISDFSKFADFFFDGLIVDWFMQTKLISALGNVRSVIDKTDSLLTGLKGLKDNSAREVKELSERIDSIIIRE